MSEHTYKVGQDFLRILETPDGYRVQHWKFQMHNLQHEFYRQVLYSYNSSANTFLDTMQRYAEEYGPDGEPFPWIELWVEGVSGPDVKHIRFIDSSYHTKFYIPDGCSVTVSRPDVDSMSYVCRYIDDYHFQFGFYTYHICEFAEFLKRAGATVSPEYIPALWKNKFEQSNSWSFGEYDLLVSMRQDGEWECTLDRNCSPYMDTEIIWCEGTILDARNKFLNMHNFSGTGMYLSR